MGYRGETLPILMQKMKEYLRQKQTIATPYYSVAAPKRSQAITYQPRQRPKVSPMRTGLLMSQPMKQKPQSQPLHLPSQPKYQLLSHQTLSLQLLSLQTFNPLSTVLYALPQERFAPMNILFPLQWIGQNLRKKKKVQNKIKTMKIFLISKIETVT